MFYNYDQVIQRGNKFTLNNESVNIVQDSKYEKMYRIELGNKTLSDMYNWEHACDNARKYLVSVVNARIRSSDTDIEKAI